MMEVSQDPRREPVLSGFGITYGYDGGAPVLRDFNIELYRGEILALIGPNGSGKSTLLKILAGVIPIRGSRGEGLVHYIGKEFFQMNIARRAQAVAYIGADLRADFPLTAFEAVMMGRTVSSSGLLKRFSNQDGQAVQKAMERCRCWQLRARDLHTLSGGERQLVSLARALAQGARVLLLDEALSRMDLHHQALTGRLLRQLVSEGFAILLVSHDLNVATEWADRSLIMMRGERVAVGPTREVLTVERIRALYPGADLIVGHNPASGAPKVFFGGSGGASAPDQK